MRRWLMEAGTVALSLVLALIIWMVAEQENSPVGMVRGVQVGLRGMEEMVALRSSLTASVDVRVRAPKSVWQTLRVTDFEAYVDLTGLGAGWHELDVQVTSLQPEVQILEVMPSKVLSLIHI